MKLLVPRAIALALLLSGATRAESVDEARELFQRGTKALERGDELEAASDFEAAYKAQPAPSLLYWLGEAHFQAGHSARAEQLFKRYLAKMPGGPKVAEARARLEELRPAKAKPKMRLKQESPKAGPAPAKKSAPPPPSAPRTALSLPRLRSLESYAMALDDAPRC